MNLDPFSQNGSGSHGLSGNSKSSAEKVFVHSKNGGAGRRAAPAEPLEPMDIPELQAEPVDEKKDEPQAVLSEGAWIKPETHFQEETEVSVKVSLPKGKEHLTRIEAELHAKTPKGPELISRGEGHAKADGTAVFTLPVYKPNGHQGEPTDYYLVFKHKIAKVFNPDILIRPISEIALKSADHVLIPGICFAKNSSFIRPKFVSGLKTLESRVKDWETKHPKGKIVIYGHADSDESEPKALSERRAESVFAFITNDAATWDKLYRSEKWGLIALQQLMLDQGDYKDTPDDKDGPNTQLAFKAVQKRSGLPESGKEDSATRKALFSAYMKGKHDIKLNADRFRKVAGNSWMGCAALNKAKEGGKPAPENRRVAFVLINESKFFPVHFPCQDGNESGCQSQCKKPGKRSVPGNKCAFYDELLREEAQAAATEPDPEMGDKILKKGDKGPVVEELNIRLAGFGAGHPIDQFVDETEKALKKFQTDWMNETNPSGVLDGKTAKAFDEFTKHFHFDFDKAKCKCKSFKLNADHSYDACGGFGKIREKGKYKSGHQHAEAYSMYERPGIHKSALWALKGVMLLLEKNNMKFKSISSGYRCWADNEFHKRTTTNHMGKALDINITVSAHGKSIDGGKSDCDKVRDLLEKDLGWSRNWFPGNRFSMEPSEKLPGKNNAVATNWVHFDVREFKSAYLEDKYFCDNESDFIGTPLLTLLEKGKNE